MPKYTADHIDRMVEGHIKYRAALREKGHILPGQPVHALAGNMAALQEREASKQEAQNKVELERQKMYVDKTTKQPLPTHEGYCVRCKKKVTDVITRGEVHHKNGAKGVHGPCPTCNTPVHAFVKKEAKK